MLTKSEISIKPDIWFGLNTPDISTSEADIAVFGIPFDGGVSYRSGAAECPDILRANTVTATPFTENFDSFERLRVVDVGNFTFESGRDSCFAEIEDFVSTLVSDNTFFTMIGGDHSTTIPVLRGIDRALDSSMGIIHIDAHFDLCDSLNSDRLSHGCTQRRSLDLLNVDGTENIFFIGIRSIEPDEFEFAKENPLNVISSAMYHRLESDRIAAEVVSKMKKFNNTYLTVDIDCLDPSFAAGTGTPQFGGLYSRQLLVLLNELFEKMNIIGMDIVEIAPTLDPSLTSMFAGRKIISECWGHYARKIGKLEVFNSPGTL